MLTLLLMVTLVASCQACCAVTLCYFVSSRQACWEFYSSLFRFKDSNTLGGMCWNCLMLIDPNVSSMFAQVDSSCWPQCVSLMIAQGDISSSFSLQEMTWTYQLVWTNANLQLLQVLSLLREIARAGDCEMLRWELCKRFLLLYRWAQLFFLFSGKGLCSTITL